MVNTAHYPTSDSSIEIIYEDDYLMAINKPAGIVVNQAQTVKDLTIQAWFLQYLGGEQGIAKIIAETARWQDLVPSDFNEQFGTPEEIFQQRQGLVHRLDKDTSGILLLAKDPGTLVNLLAQFKSRKTKKKYLCLVHGKLKVESSAIRAPIARSNLNRAKFRVEIDGKPAVTYYRVLDYYANLEITRLQTPKQKKLKKDLASYQQGFSLVECLPETGRTHQIRVHLNHIKHPIVADATYGGEKRSQLDQLWCPRQFLHAQILKFWHPQRKQAQVVEAGISDDLQEVLELLK